MDIEFIERVRECFDYDAETGHLIRKKKTGNRAVLGPCRALGKIGYRIAGFEGKLWYVHRLIWVHQFGELPDQIDHKDQDKLNNKLGNLRNVTDATNKHNWPMQRNNTSGVAGVWFHRQNKKWVAEIKLGGKKYHFGIFASIEEASAVRAEAKRHHHADGVFV